MARAPVLMDEFKSYFAADDSVSISDLGFVFAYHGFYAYEYKAGLIESWLISWNQSFNENHPFAEYADYSHDGILWQQCTSSNYLVADYINWYAEIADAPITAQPILGFVDPERKGFVAGDGHQTTLVTHNDLERTYVTIDATPVRIDPEAQQGQQSANPLAHQPDQQSQKQQQQSPREKEAEEELEEEPLNPLEDSEPKILGIIPRRIEVLTEANTTQDETKTHDDTEEHDPRHATYELLTRLAREFGEAIEAEAASNPDMRRRPEMLTADVISVAAYTRVVQQLMGREISAEVALVRLQAKASGYKQFHSLGTGLGNSEYEQELRDYFLQRLEGDPTHDYEKLFREIFSGYREKQRAFYAFVENEVRTRGDSAYAFLLGPEFRNPIEELISLLERLDYQGLLSDESIFEAPLATPDQLNAEDAIPRSNDDPQTLSCKAELDK